jgi:hypothetical protein
MSNKPKHNSPLPKEYRTTKSTTPKNPLYERKIDWTKIPLVGGFMDKKRSI